MAVDAVLSVQAIRDENTVDTRQEPTKQVMILSLLWIVKTSQEERERYGVE